MISPQPDFYLFLFRFLGFKICPIVRAHLRVKGALPTPAPGFAAPPASLAPPCPERNGRRIGAPGTPAGCCRAEGTRAPVGLVHALLCGPLAWVVVCYILWIACPSFDCPSAVPLYRISNLCCHSFAANLRAFTICKKRQFIVEALNTETTADSPCYLCLMRSC